MIAASTLLASVISWAIGLGIIGALFAIAKAIDRIACVVEKMDDLSD